MRDPDSRAGNKLIRLPRWLTSEHPFPWLFPASAMLIVFGLYPVLYSLWLSMFKRNPATRIETFRPSWNWSKVFADDRVIDAVSVTLTYTLSRWRFSWCWVWGSRYCLIPTEKALVCWGLWWFCRLWCHRRSQEWCSCWCMTVLSAWLVICSMVWACCLQARLFWLVEPLHYGGSVSYTHLRAHET